MTAQQLKNSILQMAVQGKLVPQDPNDEPASVLLDRIRAEKEQMIKDRKIKKEKNSSVIFRGKDNLPYEKAGDSEPVCIADEVPFEIPDSWEWVRLGQVVFNHGQKKPSSDFCYIDIGSIDNKNQKLNEDETILQASQAPSRARKILKDGDIIYSTVRPYLHNMCIINRRFSHEPIASTGFAVLSCYTGVSNKFLFYYLLSPAFDTYANDIENAKGVAYPAINDERLYKALIPIPPIQEQLRVVARLEDLDPFIDRYDSQYEQLENLNNDFPEQIKKSILQQAIQGKLVPQDPADEPASVLLERIRVEKEQMIKDGKIKRDKHESVIYRRDDSYFEKVDGIERCIDDEIPFEIPKNWAWCRIGQLFNLQAGKNIDSSKICDTSSTDMYPCYGGNGVRGYVNFYNRNGSYALIGRQGALCGNINFADGKFYATEHAVVVENFGLTDTHWNGLFLEALNLNKYATATAQPGLAVKTINNIFIPVPPLQEQKRIVIKTRGLFSIISRI